LIWVTGSLVSNLDTIAGGLGKLGTALGTSATALGAWGIVIGLSVAAVYALSQAVSGNVGTLDVNTQAIMRLSDAQLANAATTLIAKLGMDGFTETVQKVAAESTTTARALVEAADLNTAARDRLLAAIDREEQASARAAQRSREDAAAKQSLADAADRAAASVRALTSAHAQSFVAGGGSGHGEVYIPPEGAGAEGAIVNRPTLALIGEAGPEALVPLHKTAGNGPLPMGGGGPSVMVTVHGSVITERQLDDVVATALARWQRHNGN
jgi:hypothetical protein